VPTHHADPFDRQIIAQALVENAGVVTYLTSLRNRFMSVVKDGIASSSGRVAGVMAHATIRPRSTSVAVWSPASSADVFLDAQIACACARLSLRSTDFREGENVVPRKETQSTCDLQQDAFSW
jgi:hypothetical protein